MLLVLAAFRGPQLPAAEHRLEARLTGQASSFRDVFHWSSDPGASAWLQPQSPLESEAAGFAAAWPLAARQERKCAIALVPGSRSLHGLPGSDQRVAGPRALSHQRHCSPNLPVMESQLSLKRHRCCVLPPSQIQGRLSQSQDQCRP